MRIREIILDKKEPTVYCESFVYEPSNFEEEKFGRLFMVGRIRNVPENSFYLVNLLASRIKREYYNLRSKSPQEAFETALKEGNKVLKENQERINWLGNLDFLIAVVNEGRIYFTLLGKMNSLILREDEVVDLVRDMISEKDLFPFTTILQSNIKQDDIIVLSTSNVFSKDLLIEKSKEILPIDEEKIARFVQTEDSGVSLVIETGKTSDVVERLKPSVEVAKKPMPVSGLNFPEKEKIKEGFEKGKGFVKKIASKGKEVIKPKVEKLECSVKDKKEEVAPRIAIERMHYSQKFKTKFSRLLKQKWIIILISILLIGGIIFGINQRNKTNQLRMVEAKIEEAQDKKEESEKYIIAGDEEKALQSLVEGVEILDSIENPLSKKEEVIKLRDEINTEIAEMVGREILDDIKPLFEISENKDEKDWSPTELIIADDNFYALKKDSEIIYQWNIFENEGSFEKKESEILGGTVLNRQPFFLLSPTSVLIDKNEKTLPIELPYNNVKVTKIDTFNNFIYILDKEEGEVIKYRISSSTIGEPELWFKERNEAKESVSFAIDGSIYLLLLNGKIKRYTSGILREEIIPSETYPEIKSATRLFTSPNNEYLYMVDSKNKRIIVTDKDGNIVNEYESSQFKDIKDVWADAGDENIYVLSGNKVFKIER